MNNNKFKESLDLYLATRDSLPSWSNHLPDEIYGNIKNIDDFYEFLEFIVKDFDHQKYFEYGCEDTDIFIQRIVETKNNLEDNKYAESKGIKTEYGLLAYFIILSLGN